MTNKRKSSIMKTEELAQTPAEIYREFLIHTASIHGDEFALAYANVRREEASFFLARNTANMPYAYQLGETIAI